MLHYAIASFCMTIQKHEYSNTDHYKLNTPYSLKPTTYLLVYPPGILFMSVENQAKAYALEVEGLHPTTVRERNALRSVCYPQAKVIATNFQA